MGLHTIALSLTEVRPKGQALIGRHDLRLMCPHTPPTVPKAASNGGWGCADGVTSAAGCTNVAIAKVGRGYHLHKDSQIG